MIFKKSLLNSKDWSFTKEETAWSPDLFKDITVYYIVGEYFYHSEIEAFGFDPKEMSELYDLEFKGKQTTDIYNHHGPYLYRSANLGTMLKVAENKTIKEEKKKAFNEIERLLNLAKENL